MCLFIHALDMLPHFLGCRTSPTSSVLRPPTRCSPSSKTFPPSNPPSLALPLLPTLILHTCKKIGSTNSGTSVKKRAKNVRRLLRRRNRRAPYISPSSPKPCSMPKNPTRAMWKLAYGVLCVGLACAQSIVQDIFYGIIGMVATDGVQIHLKRVYICVVIFWSVVLSSSYGPRTEDK